MNVAGKKSKRGFTLTEMMVVITISGILLAFAIPQFTKTMRQTSDRKAKVDMLTSISAAKIYLKKSSPGDSSIDSISELNNVLGLNLNESDYGQVNFNTSESYTYIDQQKNEKIMAPDSFDLYFYANASSGGAASPYYYYYSSYDPNTQGPVGPTCVPLTGQCP